MVVKSSRIKSGISQTGGRFISFKTYLISMNQKEIKKTCLYCKKDFIATGSNRNRQIYCSLKCGDRDYHKKNYKQITHKKICIYCGISFQTNRPESLYCSNKCSCNFRYNKNKRTKKLKNCLQCGKEFKTTTSKKYCSEECRLISHYERHKAYYGRKARERNKERKLKVFIYYSNSKSPFCKKCGIKDMDILTLDHINNDGYKHRKELKSHDLYSELIKTNFPKGYQILCRNCNYKKFLDFKRKERERIIKKYYG